MSARPSREARRSPRRKAGRAASGDAAPAITFSLTIEAQEMRVDYTPYWSAGEAPYGHFEFRSPYERPRRIPVSETGYRSHFAPMAEIEAAPSPQDYARELALAVVASGPGGRMVADDGQLSLF